MDSKHGAHFIFRKKKYLQQEFFKLSIRGGHPSYIFRDYPAVSMYGSQSHIASFLKLLYNKNQCSK